MAALLPPDSPLPLIDALADLVQGEYVDPMVRVRAHLGQRPRRDLHVLRTAHFDVWRADERLTVRHGVPPDDIDDDLTSLLWEELFAPGWVTGEELFERIFTGVVRTSAASALDGWTLFYRNTLARLRELLDRPAAAGTTGHGSLADFAPVYGRALSLVPPDVSVLELGSCFGFLSVQLAADRTRRVTASDVSAGTVRLLRSMLPRLGVELATCVGDATRMPLPTAGFDFVLLVHLLEHLDPADGVAALGEACRLARRRVVVAVPYEREPAVAYGHRRTVTRADLAELGRQVFAAGGWSWSVDDHHGGWLVLDR